MLDSAPAPQQAGTAKGISEGNVVPFPAASRPQRHHADRLLRSARDDCIDDAFAVGATGSTRLVVITNDIEFAEIRSLVEAVTPGNQGVYIGFTDRASEGNFV
jgi:hypothetical protein